MAARSKHTPEEPEVVRTTEDELAELVPLDLATGSGVSPVYPPRVDEDGTVRGYFDGVELDPEDGRPVFHDGMSRRRYLEQQKAEMKAANLEELRALANADLAAESGREHRRREAEARR